jgi:MerR family transcriptional regulator, light-induced transcriptional regulator
LSNICTLVPVFRISELARRTATSTDLLRAWERRYGLLQPQRTQGGFRLYDEADVQRVERMRSGLDRGLAAAEAARAALEPGDEPAELLPALLAFDDERAHAILDDLLARLSVEAVLHDVVAPALRQIGDGWERGDVSVAQEHFAANVLRGRLVGLARRWDQGVGPRALLACAPGDQHDLPLILFGLALSRRGWRILFLGADTPLDVLARTARSERPDVVVVSRSRLDGAPGAEELGEVAAAGTLVLAGRWPDVGVEAIRLEGDPVELAASLQPLERLRG